MNKYQIMLASSISLIVGGTVWSVHGIFLENTGAACGAAVLAAGLLLLGAWISRAYTFICKDCFLRIHVNIKEALTALPSGGGCRRIYCAKCRKKTSCRARRVSLKAHVF